MFSYSPWEGRHAEGSYHPCAAAWIDAAGAECAGAIPSQSAGWAFANVIQAGIALVSHRQDCGDRVGRWKDVFGAHGGVRSGLVRFRKRRTQLGDRAVSDHSDIALSEIEGNRYDLVRCAFEIEQENLLLSQGANAEHCLGELVVGALGERLHCRREVIGRRLDCADLIVIEGLAVVTMERSLRPQHFDPQKSEEKTT